MEKSPDSNIDLRSNRLKTAIYGFFFSAGISMSEPSTILPLIVSYFSGSNVLIGLFTSLFRGGAVLMQLYAAFYAQAYMRVMRAMRWVLFFRFFFWLFIGMSILWFSDVSPALVLTLFGIGLFGFSFSAGFGTVYFQELMGKMFTHEYRGVTLAYRQFMMGLGGIVSGFLSAWILRSYEAPRSFAAVFIVSAMILAVGYLFLSSIREISKRNVQRREQKFSHFLKNAGRLLRDDRQLRLQVITRFFSWSYLFVLPFVILQRKTDFMLGGLALGSAVPLLAGAMFSNILWGRFTSRQNNRLIIFTSYILIIISLLLAVFTRDFISMLILFFLAGSGADGFKLAYANLILILAPENKRPIYIAVQNNITSLGMFFTIPGGALLTFLGFNGLTYLTIALLMMGLFLSFRLEKA